MEGRMTRLPVAALVAALVAGCHTVGDEVVRYCEDFALAYCDLDGLEYEEGSASAKKLSDLGGWVQNVVQPKGSWFTAGYGCRFEAGDRGFWVHVLLAETRGFAEHTQWEGLQILPIRRVASGGREGYGVFKYLRERSVQPES